MFLSARKSKSFFFKAKKSKSGVYIFGHIVLVQMNLIRCRQQFQYTKLNKQYAIAINSRIKAEHTIRSARIVVQFCAHQLACHWLKILSIVQQFTIHVCNDTIVMQSKCRRNAHTDKCKICTTYADQPSVEWSERGRESSKKKHEAQHIKL